MKKEKPNACWKCGQKGHVKTTCTNPEVPGSAWAPGYEPKQGTQRRPPNPPNQRMAGRKPNQVFARTLNYMAETNKAVSDDQPDCVKIFANALAKATASEDNILGDEELIRGYVHSIHTQEQDLVRRESDILFGALRRTRAHLVEKEEAMRSFIIKNLSDEVKEEMFSYHENPRERDNTNKTNISARIKKEVDYTLDPEEIDSYEFIEKNIKKKDPEDPTKETTIKVWNLKIILYRRDLVLKCIKHARNTYPEGFDPEVTRDEVTIDEYLTVEEIRNDAYVKTQVKLRNDLLIEQHGDLSGGEWKFEGRRGVRRIFFDKHDPPPNIGEDTEDQDPYKIGGIVEISDSSGDESSSESESENPMGQGPQGAGPTDPNSKRKKHDMTPSTDGGRAPSKKKKHKDHNKDKTTAEKATPGMETDERSSPSVQNGDAN